MRPALAEVPASPEEERPELLTPEDMARHLGIPRSTLDRWSYLRDFPVIREAHSVYFPWRDVVEYVRRRMAIEKQRPPAKAEIKRKPQANKRRRADG